MRILRSKFRNSLGAFIIGCERKVYKELYFILISLAQIYGRFTDGGPRVRISRVFKRPGYNFAS